MNGILIYSFLILLCSVRACARLQAPHFGTPMKDVMARKNDNVSFTCQVRNIGRHLVAFVRTDPTVLITWQQRVFFGNQQKYSLEQADEHWILHINNVQMSDEGIYMCQVNTNPMIAQIASLTLEKPPKINKNKTTHDLIVKEGSNVSLACAADGNPKPDLSWRKKNGPVIQTNEPEGFGESVIYKENFTIFNVHRSHMGEYICLASNGIPPDESWTLKLHVHFAPDIISAPSVKGKKTATARLSCFVEAWPKPTFMWKFENQFILAENYKYHVETLSNFSFVFQYQAILRVNFLERADFGVYRCEAFNEHGKITATILLEEISLVYSAISHEPDVRIVQELRVEQKKTESKENESVEMETEILLKNDHQNSGCANLHLSVVYCYLMVLFLANEVSNNYCLF
ncbi:Protein amalgam [Trichinella zimbabwensis]|uniref:Protein amalgam n=1 Tax=Trichinella zimbabwensis TaxID=268475 RepID=A0A0V1H3R9_9BILA|nr:Protein amalgam [Trichinella zimbabwensis]KRZ05011.1 Protein amalgam [Trichinella zimbabwensis]